MRSATAGAREHEAHEPDAPHGAPPPTVDQPNILFILVDDLGTEWISSYGAAGIQTPAIDRLAAGGMRFTNAYSMPQCTPTRATLLTGQYPFRHGWVNHWDVPRWGAGVHFDRILPSGPCTRCRHDVYWSYRQDPRAEGRQLSWIGWADRGA